MSLGGGQLPHYGINSNTSAIGFLKCIMRRQKHAPYSKKEDEKGGNVYQLSQVKA